MQQSGWLQLTNKDLSAKFYEIVCLWNSKSVVETKAQHKLFLNEPHSRPLQTFKHFALIELAETGLAHLTCTSCIIFLH